MLDSAYDFMSDATRHIRVIDTPPLHEAFESSALLLVYLLPNIIISYLARKHAHEVENARACAAGAGWRDLR